VTEWQRWLRREARSRAEREVSDARPVAEPARRRSLDPEIGRRVKLRRRALVLGLSGVCLAGSVAAFIGEGGYLDVRRLRHEIAGLQADIERREAAVARLEEEVLRLEKDAMARERIAREQLGLVRPGEIDFLLPREPLPAREPAEPGRDAAEPRP
jgi:cell division protein FtsB